jgi:hypothetical protein
MIDQKTRFKAVSLLEQCGVKPQILNRIMPRNEWINCNFTAFKRNNTQFGMKPISKDDFKTIRLKNKSFKVAKGTVIKIF